MALLFFQKTIFTPLYGLNLQFQHITTLYIINKVFSENEYTCINCTSILSPQPLWKKAVIYSVNSTLPFFSSNFAQKIPSRYVSMYVFRLFRLSRQLRCNSENPVNSRLTAATLRRYSQRGLCWLNWCQPTMLHGNIYPLFSKFQIRLPLPF